MSQITRMWLGFAGIGAGTIHLALVISSPLPIAIALLVLGLVEFAWGVFTFARDSLVAPRIARIVAVAPVIGWSLLVVLATLLDTPEIASSLSLIPMLLATAFEIFVAGALSLYLRRTSDGLADAAMRPAPPAGRYLLALFVGALITAGMTTPALAATEAGRFAQPHGHHDADFVPEPTPSDGSDPLDELVLPDHENH